MLKALPDAAHAGRRGARGARQAADASCRVGCANIAVPRSRLRSQHGTHSPDPRLRPRRRRWRRAAAGLRLGGRAGPARHHDGGRQRLAGADDAQCAADATARGRGGGAGAGVRGLRGADGAAAGRGGAFPRRIGARQPRDLRAGGAGSGGSCGGLHRPHAAARAGGDGVAGGHGADDEPRDGDAVGAGDPAADPAGRRHGRRAQRRRQHHGLGGIQHLRRSACGGGGVRLGRAAGRARARRDAPGAFVAGADRAGSARSARRQRVRRRT